MSRKLSSSFAFLAALAFGGAAAPALAAQYSAEPLFAPMQDRIVVRDTLWQRNGALLEAGRSSSRPAVVCAVLVREVGQLKSFRIAGTPISPAELEKCNARAAR